MKLKKESMLLGVLVGVLLTAIVARVIPADAKSGSQSVAAVYRNIRVFVDGVEKKPNAEPFLIDGSTFVPLRFISEALGKEISWDGETNSIYIGKPPTVKPSAAPAVQSEDYSGTYEQTERTINPSNSRLQTLHWFTLSKISGADYKFDFYGNIYNLYYNPETVDEYHFFTNSPCRIENGKGVVGQSGSLVFTFQPDGSIKIEGYKDQIKGGGTIDGIYKKK